MNTFFRALLVACLSFFHVSPAYSAGKYDAAVESFRKTLTEMVHADTSNPPGNEARIVELVSQRLKSEGIPFDVTDFAPGRQNIVARMKGTGSEKPLLLLAHLDVVGTQNQKWSSDPHVVTEKDGYLVGRGVSDDLGMAAVALEVFVLLKHEATPLRRDVILALTGDEESGGRGIQDLLRKRPELINASIALNEGGGPILGENGKMKYVALQTAEKTYQDFQLSTSGTTGHSSVPVADNSIYRLAAALEKLGHYRMPDRLIPVTRAYFEKRARLESGKLAEAMRALSRAKGALPSWAVREVEKDPTEAANLHTTCVATLLNGGTKENALPPTATANVNCRILPDETPEQVQKRLVSVISDSKVKVEPVGEFGVAGPSATDGEVPAAVEKVSGEFWPHIPIIPTMSRGATDSRYLREKGIAAYGIDPIAMTESDERRAHGIDERIQISNIEPGMEYFHRLVLALAGAPELK